MIVLIRKSNSTIVNQWPSTPNRVEHPDKPGGALCVGTPSPLPFDLGDFILVEAAVVGAEPFDPATENRSGPVFVVAVDYSTTETYTVTPKSPAELTALSDAQDRGALSRKALDLTFVTITLIDVLLAKGVITVSDLDAKARAAYQSIKPIADRVKAQ